MTPAAPLPHDPPHEGDALPRNRYYSGKLMTAAGLRRDQDYARWRREQLSRAVMGAGVIEGFKLSIEEVEKRLVEDIKTTLEIPLEGEGVELELDVEAVEVKEWRRRWLKCSSGFAIDHAGRVLHRTVDRRLAWHELWHASDLEHAPDPAESPQAVQWPGHSRRLHDRTYWLAVHYAVRGEAAVQLEDGTTEFDQLADTLAFVLHEKAPTGQECRVPAHRGDGGLVEVVQGLWIDPGHGLPLATLEVREQDGRSRLRLVTSNLPPVVATNPELKECCEALTKHCQTLDRTVGLLQQHVAVLRAELRAWRGVAGAEPQHITAIHRVSWDDWILEERRIRWEVFASVVLVGREARAHASVEGVVKVGLGALQADEEWVGTALTLHFTGPVAFRSLTSRSLELTVWAQDDRTQGFSPMRVPILVRGLADHQDPPDPEGTVRAVQVFLRQKWIEHNRQARQHNPRSVCGEGTRFRVELAVHGDLVLDADGQAIDAWPTGPEPRTGQRSARGGTFLSYLDVSKDGKSID